MHFYGPFSDELAEEFEEDIQKNHILTISPDNKYIYLPGTKCEAETEKGFSILGDHKEKFDLLLNRFGNKSPGDLELYSTIHFICDTLEVFYKTNDKNHRIEEIKKAKYPKFSEPKILKCYDEMKEWKLIS
ncbi:hypothetical protein DCCM_2356 [Desulfocucumis palustris]|uniref:Uncharacterized protein n=2 Tax=Desulfocucumis palustris TaxID=1898651 RepID=A0A2L2XAF6_9FIRM|nr:hypothetical protein DCCM_2356 [Desulfocucumis palustris]